MEQLKVTSLEKLIEYNQGEIVKLPDFGEGQEFVARLKRPSLLSLVKHGKIPNSLLVTANSLFMGKTDFLEDDGRDTLSEIFKVIDIIAEAAFIEPNYKEIKEAGIELTDEQYMAVFNYTQKGVKALEPFRKK